MDNKRKSIPTEKIPEEDADPEDFDFQQIHSNLPYWDFKYSQDEYGFEYNDASKDGFHDLVENLFVTILSKLRNAFIKGDVKDVKDLAHLYKGNFRLFSCHFIGDPSDELMKYCLELLPEDKKKENLNGQPTKTFNGGSKHLKDIKVTEKMRDLYIDLIIKVELFIGIFANFSYATSIIFLLFIFRKPY